MRPATIVAALVILACPAIAAADTTITVEILSDGTCSIAVHGARSRSEMSYRSQTPGRCSVPSTRERAEVALEVRLPAGSPLPGGSIPRLAWRHCGGRPCGSARLPAAPAFVDVMPAGGLAPSRLNDLLLIGAAAAAMIWALVVGTERT